MKFSLLYGLKIGMCFSQKCQHSRGISQQIAFNVCGMILKESKFKQKLHPSCRSYFPCVKKAATHLSGNNSIIQVLMQCCQPEHMWCCFCNFLFLVDAHLQMKLLIECHIINHKLYIKVPYEISSSFCMNAHSLG